MMGLLHYTAIKEKVGRGVIVYRKKEGETSSDSGLHSICNY